MDVTKRISIHFEHVERTSLLDTIEHILEPKRVGFKQYIELRPEDVAILKRLQKGLNAFEPKEEKK
jgi:hypothetical protein